MDVIRLSPETFENAVQKAAEVLRHGGIVLYPTDTLYGLAVDACNAEAIEKLQELKGRDKSKPISVVVSEVADIYTYAEVPPNAEVLIEKFLPGPLTLVLSGHANLPSALMHAGQIGIRIPNDSFARSLAKELGRPITATSANRAGEITPATCEEIIQKLPDIDLAIDGGERRGGIGSTVVTFSNGYAQVLREGVLSAETLEIQP